MSRYARRKDTNHNSIAEGLMEDGWSVMDLSRAGGGVPDILVGRAGNGVTPGICVVVEVKNGEKAKLTPKEQEVRDRWEGPYLVATSLEDIREKLRGLLP